MGSGIWCQGNREILGNNQDYFVFSGNRNRIDISVFFRELGGYN